MRIIDGNTIETECDSCARTFICGRGEDGEPDEILCSECKQTWQELRTEIARERGLAWKAWLELQDEIAKKQDRVWLETFLSFPFKALPAPSLKPTCEYCDSPDHHISDCIERKAWRDYQDLMDAADQAAYYSPRWEENR